MNHTFPPSRQARNRRGFTLIEILVVLTIIIVMAAAALPAMRFITGSRSVEGTQNIVAAMISRARAEAIANHEQRGVFFFLDPVDDRTKMAIVGGDFNQYMGWTQRTGPATPIDRNPANMPPLPAQHNYYGPNDPVNTDARVISLTGTLFTPDTNGSYLNMIRRVTRPYLAVQTAADTTGGQPTALVANAYWQPAGPFDIIPDTDLQVLPQGVGVQLINSNPASVANVDRYLRIGVIMFDKKGDFECIPWSVKAGSALGGMLHLAADLDVTTVIGGQTTPVLYSQFGVILYDRQTFLGQTSSGGNYTDGDNIFSPNFQGKTFFQAAATPKFPVKWDPDEKAEEDWLDRNSLPLLIDRHSGTLLKGE